MAETAELVVLQTVRQVLQGQLPAALGVAAVVLPTQVQAQLVN
tara:strand:- start:346 stop:474 length:129 start_codon:yes stop_codon:yes gene_type:complete